MYIHTCTHCSVQPGPKTVHVRNDSGVLALTPVTHTQAVSRNPQVAKKGARPGQEVERGGGGGGGGGAFTRRAP